MYDNTGQPTPATDTGPHTTAKVTDREPSSPSRATPYSVGGGQACLGPPARVNRALNEAHLLSGDLPPDRLGVAYLLRATDTLEGVGKRFGMSMRNLMQLNPDIVVANLVHSPSDTRPS